MSETESRQAPVTFQCGLCGYQASGRTASACNAHYVDHLTAAHPEVVTIPEPRMETR